MEKELPEIIIEGTTFQVDVRRSQLIEKDNAVNVISVHSMRYEMGNYFFNYDLDRKNIGLGHGLGRQRSVRMNGLTEIDPEGMADRLGRSVADILGKSDYDVIVDKEDVEARLSGKPVTIDIAGNVFFVDCNLELIRPQGSLDYSGIPFNDAFINEESKLYRLPFDLVQKESRVFIEGKITEIPRDTVIVEFPPPWELDPIGYFQRLDMDWEKQLLRYPPKSHHVANIIPWEKTNIMSIVEANNKRRLLKRVKMKVGRQKR